VGPGVSKVKDGDRVILSWIKGSGADVPGSVYKWNDRSVNAGAITTFNRHAVISENRLTIITQDIPLREAAMLGCAVPTGVGAVFNTAQPRPGQSIAIFGTGGVGLCAVMGAAIAGCTPIIAVDVQEAKLRLAEHLGATHRILAVGRDPVEEINRICPGGLDFAIEASGRPAVMLQALQSVRNQGGVAVVVGNARYGERVELDPTQLNQGKRLLGTWGGDNWPDRDYMGYCRLLRAGKLNLAALMSRTYSLEQVNESINDLEAGKVARPLIDLAVG
jgi:S-(hydroxymethyl)glutathione dehydrogenase/alcohol dehydrogenase